MKSVRFYLVCFQSSAGRPQAGDRIWCSNTSQDCADRALGKAFRESDLLCTGGMFQVIYFSLVKIRLEMMTGKDFAADALGHIYGGLRLAVTTCGIYVASWRAGWTRNYNACPDLEGCFEADSAIFLCLCPAVSGGYCSFGHSCGSNGRAANDAVL